MINIEKYKLEIKKIIISTLCDDMLKYVHEVKYFLFKIYRNNKSK